MTTTTSDTFQPAGASQARGRPGRWLAPLAIATATTAYILIVFGSHVRVTESGMGCPSWPLCYDAYGPIPEFHALMEQVHRYLAALVTILVAATAVSALRGRRNRPAALRPALWSCGVIGVQVALGAITVFASNEPWTVAMHLIAGLSLLAITTVTAVCALAPRRPASGPRLRPLAWVTVGATFLLLLAGSLVVVGEHEEVVSCPSWPLCTAPGADPAMVALHLAHRGVALLAGIAIVVFALHALRDWRAVRGARVLAAASIVLLLVTAGAGAISAIFEGPLWWQDAHLAAASAVLVVVVALAAAGWLAGADSRQQPDGPDQGKIDSSLTPVGNDAVVP